MGSQRQSDRRTPDSHDPMRSGCLVVRPVVRWRRGPERELERQKRGASSGAASTVHSAQHNVEQHDKHERDSTAAGVASGPPLRLNTARAERASGGAEFAQCSWPVRSEKEQTSRMSVHCYGRCNEDRARRATMDKGSGRGAEYRRRSEKRERWQGGCEGRSCRRDVLRMQMHGGQTARGGAKGERRGREKLQAKRRV